MNKYLLCMFFVSISIPALSAVNSEKFNFDSAGVKSIEVDNQKGWIKIMGTQEAKINIEVEKINFDKKCRLLVKKSGDDIEIDVDRDVLINTQLCEANITISVPDFIDLDIENGSGDLTITNTKGEIDYKIGSGNVVIHSLDLTELEGKIGSGNAEVKGLTGSADLISGAGNLDLDYTSISNHTKLEIKTGSGNVKLALPSKAQIDLNTLMGSGKVDSEFTQDSKAPFKISFKSGSGNLEIKKKKK